MGRVSIGDGLLIDLPASCFAPFPSARRFYAAAVAVALFALAPVAACGDTQHAPAPQSFPVLPESSWIDAYSNRALPAMVRALGVDDPTGAYTPGVVSRDGVAPPPVDADMALARVALTWPCPGLTRAAFAPAPAVPLAGVSATGPLFASIVDGVLRASRETAMDPAVMMAIAEIESRFSPSARSRTSTATGLFQFVEQSWLQAMKSFGARHGRAGEAQALANGLSDSPLGQEQLQKILDLRNDPYLSAALAGEVLARDSARVARQMRRRLTAGEIYMIHFFGVGDATRLLWAASAAPTYPAAALFPKPAWANPGIFYENRYGMFMERSVLGVYAMLENMIGWRANRYRRLSARQVERVANAQ